MTGMEAVSVPEMSLIRNSRARLTMSKPFFGFMLAGLNPIHDPSFRAAMGVALRKDGSIQLIFNEKWMIVPADGSKVLDLSKPVRPWIQQEIDAVTEHEVLHLLYGHLTRIESRNPRQWNQATDIAINQLIQGLPVTGLFPETYGLPKGLSADQYYDLLENSDQDECPICGGSHPDDSTGSGAEEGGSEGPSCPGSGGGLDDHGVWNAEGVDSGMVRDLVKDLVSRAWNESGGRLANQGKMSGDVIELIERVLTPTRDWRSELNMVGRSLIKLGNKVTIHRENRRYAGMTGKRHTRAATVVVIFDTSGSVDAKLLNQFFNECARMVQRGRVIVAECDTTIQNVYEYRRGMHRNEAKGRGGTDFRSVFAAVAGTLKEKTHALQGWLAAADATFVLTDGFATVPESNVTGRPVVWALTPGGSPPTSMYGQVVRIGEWSIEQLAEEAENGK